MTIPSPSAVTVLSPSALVLPELLPEPLQTALTNVNAVYRFHSPAHIQCTPAEYTGAAGPFVYYIPVRPSSDGLDYNFAAAFDSSITVTRTYSATSGTDLTTAVFASIGSTTGSTGASGIVTDGPFTLSASHRILKVEISVSSGTVWPQSLCVYPATQAVPTGSAPCGFRSYDDGVLGQSDSPIHQEFLDRCKRSSLIVYKDRRQCAYAFVTEATARANHLGHATSSMNQAWPRGRMRLPGYTQDTTFRVEALAEHGAGGPVTRAITVTLTGKTTASTQMDADATVNSATLTVQPQSDGLGAFVDVDLQITGDGVGDVYCHSVIIWPEV